VVNGTCRTTCGSSLCMGVVRSTVSILSAKHNFSSRAYSFSFEFPKPSCCPPVLHRCDKFF
jgi:hypothetical protein